MENLIRLLHVNACSCVIAHKNQIRTFTGRGVADLYDLFQNNTSFLCGSLVADKVIGKAAAALMILGEVKQVYADIISQPALTLLEESGLSVQFGKIVPFIENRDKTGWCPLESASYELNSPKEIFLVIQDFISKIRK